MLKEEEIKAIVQEAVTEAMAHHACWMSEEDKAMVRDMVQGGKYVKTSILVALAGGIIYAVAKGVALIKGWTFLK